MVIVDLMLTPSSQVVFCHFGEYDTLTANENLLGIREVYRCILAVNYFVVSTLAECLIEYFLNCAKHLIYLWRCSLDYHADDKISINEIEKKESSASPKYFKIICKRLSSTNRRKTKNANLFGYKQLFSVRNIIYIVETTLETNLNLVKNLQYSIIKLHKDEYIQRHGIPT